MFQQRSATSTLLAIGLDWGSIGAALFIAVRLRDSLPLGTDIPTPIELPSLFIFLTALTWSATFFLFSVYDPRKNHHLVDELRALLTANLFALLVLAGLLYFSYRDISRLLILYFFGLALGLSAGWRVGAKGFFRVVNRGRGGPTRRVLIIGATELGQQIAGMIHEYAWTGLALVGFLDDHPLESLGPVLGSLHEAHAVVRREHIDEVIMALPYSAYENLEQIILELQTLPVQVRIAPNYFNLVLYRANVEVFSGMPLINLRDPALSAYQRLVKRAFDLVIGTLALIAASPAMALIALAIRLDSPGPSIFRQKRVGENGRLFTMYKFRSMRADSDTPRLPQANTPLLYKVPEDPRITRVGHFIRRTSLDELPQLVNVLRGDMSLVGPRPEMPWMVEKYEPWQHKRFAIPQGMTGWWQINGRSDRPMYLHTEDDLYYIQNYSLLLDILILWRTIFAVIKRKGAY